MNSSKARAYKTVVFVHTRQRETLGAILDQTLPFSVGMRDDVLLLPKVSIAFNWLWGNSYSAFLLPKQYEREVVWTKAGHSVGVDLFSRPSLTLLGLISVSGQLRTYPSPNPTCYNK